jgi:nitrate reductase beta subunit
MNIKVQMGMVLNLDKCLACHTCSIPCKNAWTTAPGTEYMWFNNVETKPGVGYPKEWENQDRYKGGWEIRDGKLHLRAGGKTDKLANIFANPDLPALDDYYEPWKYDYERLTDSPASRHQPVARPYSAVTGKAFNPQWGSNWEDDLGGAPVTGLSDCNFAGLEAKAYLDFKNVFMMHLPRLCEHCLNPACVVLSVRGHVQARRRRDRAGGPVPLPRVALLRIGVPVQEGVLQLEDAPFGKVSVLLSAHRSGRTYPVCAQLRGPHPVRGRHAVRCRPGARGRLAPPAAGLVSVTA